MVKIKLIVFIVFAAVIVVLVLKNREKLRQFLNEVSLEMSKVTWPSRDEVVNCTILVCVTTLILTIITGLIDIVYARLVGLIF
jgi:preprotein translocase subunit SecE